MKKGMNLLFNSTSMLAIYLVSHTAFAATTPPPIIAPTPATQSIAPGTDPNKPVEKKQADMTDDEKIISELQKEFDKKTNAPIKIKIEEEDDKRIISLAGSVSDAKTAILFVIMARTTQSIDDINYDDFFVNNKPLTPDNIICIDILIQYREQLFASVEDVSKMPITVSSYNGLVFLDGTVDNHDILRDSILIAQKTPKVQRVISRLEIRKVIMRMPN